MGPKAYRTIRPMFETGRWRIFRGDEVFINNGPHANMSGKVLEVIKDKRVPQVLVEGVNLRKKKIYTGAGEEDFYVVTMEAPVHYSQVSLLQPAQPAQPAQPGVEHPQDEQGPAERWVRAKFRYLADGTRVRVGKGRNADPTVVIPIPVELEPEANAIGQGAAKDTVAEEVVKSTKLQPAIRPSSSTSDFKSFASSVFSQYRASSIARARSIARSRARQYSSCSALCSQQGASASQLLTPASMKLSGFFSLTGLLQRDAA